MGGIKCDPETISKLALSHFVTYPLLEAVLTFKDKELGMHQ